MAIFARKHPARPRWSRRVLALFTLLALLAIASAAALGLAYINSSPKLLEFTKATLSKFTSAEIDINSVKLAYDGSIMIRDFAVKPRESSEFDNTIFRASRIRARFSLWSLIRKEPRMTELGISDFKLSMLYDADKGEWNTPGLAMIKGAGNEARMPQIKLENGALTYSKIVGGGFSEILYIPIDADFTCSRGSKTLAFHLTTATRNGIKGTDISGTWYTGRCGSVELSGRLSSANVPVFDNVWNFERFNARLSYDPNTIILEQLDMTLGRNTPIHLSGAIRNYTTRPTFDIRTSIENIYHTRDAVPNAFVYSKSFLDNVLGSIGQKFFNGYSPHGYVDINLVASGTFEKLRSAKCTGTLFCRDVSVIYEDFLYQLDHITGNIEFTSKSLQLDHLKARHGDSLFDISGYSRDSGPNWDVDIHIKSDRMPLDDDLCFALSDREKKLWHEVAPVGSIKVDYQFKNTPGRPRIMSAACTLLGVEAMYCKFPYPLKNLSGLLTLGKQGAIFDHVISRWDNRVIDINGTVLDPNHPRYDLHIDARNIPFDEQFRKAVPAHQQAFCRNLDMAGMVNLAINVKNAVSRASLPVLSDITGDPNVDYDAAMQVRADWIKYPKLPVDLTNADVNLIVAPTRVHINRLTANAADARIRVSGDIEKDDPCCEQFRYCLAVEANGIDLTGPQLKKLPPGIVKVLDELQAKGMVNVHARLHGPQQQGCPEDVIAVQCLGDSMNIPKLPFVLNSIRGEIALKGTRLDFNDLTAAADQGAGKAPLNLSLSGRADMTGTGLKAATFSVAAKNLVLDKQIADALPLSVRKTYNEFALAGAVDIDADRVHLTRSGSDVNTLDVQGSLHFRNWGFKAALPVTELNGSLKLNLAYAAGSNFKADAKLDCEQFRVKSRLLKNVQCDVVYDDRAGKLQVREIVANIYGGKVFGSFEFAQGNYLLACTANDINVAEFAAASNTADATHINSGRLSGSLNVYTPADANEPRKGTLRIKVVDMQVAKLGLLGKMLLVLKLTEPTDYAFDSFAATAYLNRNDVIFDRLQFTGKSLAFSGSGKVNLDPGTVNLVFTAAGPRLLSNSSILKSLAEGFAPAVIRVNITGPLSDPRIEQTTLPVIHDTLEILGTRITGSDKTK
jgi:hypothetical protein